jgi:hypothetical protein
MQVLRQPVSLPVPRAVSMEVLAVTDEEFVKRVPEAEGEYDSDWLAWKVQEIAEEYRSEA